MLLASFAVPASLENQTEYLPSNGHLPHQVDSLLHPASASGAGADQVSNAYMSRAITGQQVSILNSYISPNSHETLLDLSGYLESGWTLYEVEIDAQSLTAAVEREVV
ncbi:MAG: hypothetical protein ACW98J_01850, partial [Candidatus Thorarchaeota archaeon]